MTKSTDHTKPLDPNCRYVVLEVITDSVTEEKGYVLSPIGKYAVRQVKPGDIFQPVGYDPREVE